MGSEGPSIIVDDLLSFLAFKKRDCSKEKLLRCVQDFYSFKVGMNSYKTLISALNEKRKYSKLKETPPKNPFLAIYESLELISEEDVPVFVCKNLNNVPILTKDVKNTTKGALRKSSTFMKEHHLIKNQITEVFQSLYQLKESVQYLSEKTSPNPDLLIGEDGIKVEDLSDYGDDDTDEDEDELSDESTSDMDDLGDYHDDDGTIEEEMEDQTIDLTRNVDQAYLPEEEIVALLKMEQEEMQMDSNAKPELSEDEDNIESSATCFYELKHVFDSTIGYFTVYICSNCQYYSNHEPTIKKHECMSFDEIINQRQSIYDQFNFDKNKKITEIYEQEELQPKERSGRPKISAIYGVPHRCPLCKNKFPLEDWLNHVRQCPGDGETTRESIYCSICDVFYSDASLMRYHAGYHDEAKPYECLQCKFRFTTQTEVDKHFARHLPERMSGLKCPLCPFSLTKTASLTDHIRSHTGEKPFPCTICGASYRSNAKLKTHLLVHQKRNFFCPICFKGFKTEVSLNKHKQQHATNKDFTCTLCSKSFKNQKAMLKHSQKHFQTFGCPHCTFRAQSNDALKEHLNCHIRCFICEFSTCSKATYRKHMREMHEQDLLAF